jgi:hypothetical protein
MQNTAIVEDQAPDCKRGDDSSHAPGIQAILRHHNLFRSVITRGV